MFLTVAAPQEFLRIDYIALICAPVQKLESLSSKIFPILIEPAAWRYQSRNVGFEPLDDGVGCIFMRAVLEIPRKRRTRHHVGNADKSPKEIVCAEVPASVAALDCAPHQGANRLMRWARKSFECVLLFIAARCT